MDRERAKELLPVITAFSEGSDVQWRRSEDSPWQTYAGEDSSVTFASGGEYRIKPEPFECWVNVYNDGCICAHSTKKKAKRGTANTSGRTVHMREVE